MIEYREGADSTSSLKLRDSSATRTCPPAGPHDFARTLGLVEDRPRWSLPAPQCPHHPARRRPRAVLRWLLREAWLAKIEISELDACKSEVAIETIELAHEGLELDD